MSETSWVITMVGIMVMVQGVDGVLTDGIFPLYRDDGNRADAKGAVPELGGETSFTETEFLQNGRTLAGTFADTWRLTLNINPSDGNDAGLFSQIWTSADTVGTISQRFSHDYRESSTGQTPFDCLAIMRHDGSNYDGVKVWKMNESKSFYGYFNSGTHGARDVVTTGGPVQFTTNPDSVTPMTADPILASSGVNNNLAFNWVFGNNGARVLLTDVGHYSGTLSGINDNDDDSHGLGNDLCTNCGGGGGLLEFTHDASVLQPDCYANNCVVQGTDHGSGFSSGTKLGNYAFFTANVLDDGNCPNFRVSHAFGSVVSAVPSAEPTLFPSFVPSTIPSAEPTLFPSFVPSSLPSTPPTTTASSVPSAEPTLFPSFAPSAIPSTEPTLFPSFAPSSLPSTSPSVTPSSVPSAEPTLLQSAAPTTGDSAGGGGDPHFFGFGDMFFTWQGHCDIILLQAPEINERETYLEVHARTKRVRSWSTIEAVAIKANEDVTEIGSNNGKLIFNGRIVEPDQIRQFTVVKTIVKSFPKLGKVLKYDFTFDKDKQLTITVNTRTAMVYVDLSGNYPDTKGILGSPHNPGLFARDGTQMGNSDINKFVESWQIRDNDKYLFQQKRPPQYPSKCIYDIKQAKRASRPRRLKEVHTISMEEANAACSSHPSGPLRLFCIEDTFNTADIDSARESFYG